MEAMLNDNIEDVRMSELFGERKMRGDGVIDVIALQ
ncbi:hypothetical protein SBC2_08670 [Caballeronia sp. SBC2]|nr:hypothetical protein SBC2_08670 [Caballeronia sp. SBC2]